MPLGVNLPGTTARERAIRQVIYQNSSLISVGTKLIPEQQFGVLDVQFEYPGQVSAEYPLTDTGVASRQAIKWSKFNKTLEKGQARFFQSDSATIRRIQQATNKMNVQRAAEAMAVQKDRNILDTLKNGVDSTLSVAAAAKWGEAGDDPEDDIVKGWSKIVEKSNVQVSISSSNATTTDTMFCVVPAQKWGELNKLQLINNVQQSLASYLTGSFQLEFYATRAPQADALQKGQTWPITTQALMGVKGDLTAIHGIYDGSEPSVPLVEETRVHGAGYDYIVTQFFNTGIIEDGQAGAGENYRLYEITGVA